MQLTSKQTVNNSKKIGNAWSSMFLLLSIWQGHIPLALTIASTALLTAEVATAAETAPVTLVQAFGWDSSHGGYKALIQTKNGNQYFVWYGELIGAKVGSSIMLTYEGSGPSMYFHKLINPGSGKEARVDRYLKAN